MNMPTLAAHEFVSELHANTHASGVSGTRVHRGSLSRPAYDPDSYLALMSGDRVGLLAGHEHEL
jgi:hypothetical protein